MKVLLSHIQAIKIIFCIIEAVSPIFLTRLNISKSTNIQRYYRIFFKSSYFNFVSDSICVMRDFSIPLTPPKKMNNRREMCCLEVEKVLIYDVQMLRAIIPSLLGFVIYIKYYGGSSVSNPLTLLNKWNTPIFFKSSNVKES